MSTKGNSVKQHNHTAEAEPAHEKDLQNVLDRAVRQEGQPDEPASAAPSWYNPEPAARLREQRSRANAHALAFGHCA